MATTILNGFGTVTCAQEGSLLFERTSCMLIKLKYARCIVGEVVQEIVQAKLNLKKDLYNLILSYKSP